MALLLLGLHYGVILTQFKLSSGVSLTRTLKTHQAEQIYSASCLGVYVFF